MILGSNPMPASLLARIADLEPKPLNRQINSLERSIRVAAMFSRHERDPGDWRAARVVELVSAWSARAACADLA